MESSVKKLTKNTIYLYIKTFASLVISLYTSRMVLVALGVSDFGIWNVIAGVVAMFSFLETSMSGAVSRFISYDLGRGDTALINKTFNSSIQVHILIAVIVFVLAETVGLYFFKNALVIPAERMPAASFIYQCVIVTTLLTMLKVPFVAVIMGAEEMKFFSIVEILYNVLKLVNVLLLLRYAGDRLVAYGVLNILVTLVVLILYYLICRLKFSFCRIHLEIEKGLGKKILAFSGFDLFSSVSVVARSQGVNMLLNMFFGVVMNAASGVAMQVQGVVLYFGRNLFDAARPRIIKYYSTGEYEKMGSLINKSSQLTTMVLLLLSVPLIVEIDYVLKLWLSVVPDYASIFCRYVLMFNIMTTAFLPVTIGIHATGRIKWISIMSGMLYILVVPFAYIGYKVGWPAEIAYAYNLFAAFIVMFVNVGAFRKYVNFFSAKCFVMGVLKCFAIGFLDYLVVQYLSQQMESSFLRLVISVAVSSLFLLALTYIFVLSREDKEFVFRKLGIRKNSAS